MSKKPSDVVQVKVRMREDLRRKIERAAEKNGLTVNAEILRRLDQTFDVTLDKLEGSVTKLSRVEDAMEEVRVKMEQLVREQLELQRRYAVPGKKDQEDQS